MFFDSVGYSLILWLVLAAFLWIRFERWAMVSRNGIRILGANLVLLAPIVIGLGYASFSLLNRELDPGPATPHRLALYDALKMPYSKSARLNPHVYVAVVPSWRKPSEYENLRVSRAKFEHLWSFPGKDVVVTTRPGRFGYEWWELIERAPK